MACSCRQHKNISASMALSGLSASAAISPMAATIDLPASLARPAAAARPTAGLSSRDCLQKRSCSPCRCSCPVRQRLSLSGTLSGLSSALDLSVFYTIQGMPGIAVTDAAGRYTIDAYLGENVVITAPGFAGYMVTPEQYTLSPACYSRQDLDFHYTPLIFSLSLASQTLAPYTLAPNVWPLGGGAGESLIMLERILVTLPGMPEVVKYAPGVHDEAYFLTGGEDITATWATGIPAQTDGSYTIYARLSDGGTEIGVIDVEGMRDGSEARPWLLLDFDTALSLEAKIPGIERFSLQYMQGGGEKLAQYYELYEDIDMAGRAWLPLGDIVPAFPVEFNAMFTGGLNGNGHVIDNLTPSNLSGSVKALFACLGGGATIRNLRLDHYHAESQGEEDDFYEIYGGFAAAANITDGQAITFDHCSISGSLSSYAIFGLAAFLSYVTEASGPVSITHCEVSMIVNGLNETGGFVGFFSGNGQGALHFADCVTTGSISGLQQVGGYVGGWNIDGGTVNHAVRCVNQMHVQASSYYAGGFVGTAYVSGENAMIRFDSCYNAGSVTGRDEVGGFLGRIGGSGTEPGVALEVADCYNTGTIAGQLGYYSNAGAGGIVGLTQGPSTIRRCYSTGGVQMAGDIGTVSHAGGIAGSYSTLENCAALGQSVSGGMPLVARVSAGPGEAPEALLASNLAWDGMQVLIGGVPKNPMEEGASLSDGESRSAASLKSQTTYQSDLGWDFESAWQFGNAAYDLPVLRGIPMTLQPQVMPPHLA